MAHAGTTGDLGLTRPTTNEKRPGWFRTSLSAAAAIALGLAVGAGAWTLAGTHSASVADKTAQAAAIHERIEAHQAAVTANVDRSFDSIESQRTQMANGAAFGDLPFVKTVDNLSIRRGYDAMPAAADHRLDAIETAGGVSPFKPADNVGSDRRGYPAAGSSTDGTFVARAYTQGVVKQVMPLTPTDPFGTAYSNGLLIGNGIIADPLPLVISAAGSVVAGAAPVDTPWGPRPAGIEKVRPVSDTRGGLPEQLLKFSNWVWTPEGNRPLP